MADALGHIRKSGFTLVEVLVATSIGAFVALVAIVSMRSASTAATAVQDNSDKAIELRFAARRLALDLNNIIRDTDPNNFRLVVGVEDSGYGTQSYLTFWTALHEKARQGQPEGDVYEVGYYVTGKEGSPVFCRRVWPHPSRDVTEPGGVVTVLSDQIAVMRVTCFDGEKWQDVWPDDAQELPHLIEVTLVAKGEKGMALSESILVTVITSSEAQAQAQAQAEAEVAQVEGAQGSIESTSSGQTTTTTTGQTATGGGR